MREALGYGAPHYPLADHYNNDRWMYGDAHKKLVKSGDWREHIDLHHAPLHHRRHRARPRFPGVGGALGAASMRRSRDGLLAIVGGFLGRDLRHGPRTLEALGLAALDRAGVAAAAARGRS